MEFKPFPGIARFPEEPKLEGVPANPEESLFVSSPELAWLLDFPHKNSEQVHKEIKQFTDQLVFEPEKLEGLFVAFDMLENVPGYSKVLRYKEKIIDGIKKINFRETPSLPDKAIEKWLSYYAEETVFKDIAENFLKQFIRSNKDPKSTVECLYNLLLIGIKSGNQKIEKLVSEIVCNGAGNILDSDSKQFAMMTLATWVPNDDENLKKSMDLDMARDYYVYVKYPELKSQYYGGLNQSFNKKENLVEFQKMCAQWDQAKLKKLTHLLDNGSKDKSAMTMEDMTADEYPNNVIFKNPSELRKLVTKLFVQERNRSNPDEQRIDIVLPNFQGGIDNHEAASGIKNVLMRENKKPEIETDEAYWESLSHLHPENIDHEKLELIAQENQRLTQEIQTDTRYLLSPRGDLLEVADDDLKNLGFETMLYEMDPQNKRDTVVTVKIGNFSFRLLLDEFFTFKQADTKNGLLLPPDGEFLKNIILSHLREIRCSEKLKEVGEDKTPEAGGKSAFYSRRAHRRKLPTGQTPSAEQIQRTWEHYHIDIPRINQETKAHGEEKQITFVFEVKNIAASGLGPVRSQAPDATKKLRQIIS